MTNQGYRPFDFKPYFKTLSYREVLTAVSLALIWIAFLKLLLFYYSEDFVYENYDGLRFIVFFSLLFLNHLIYRREHRRSNNFVGRNLQTLLFLIAYSIFQFTEAAIEGFANKFSFLQFFFLVLIALFLVLLFEILVSLVKRIAVKFGWQIL